MHPIVEGKVGRLAEICRKYGVQRLWLFGSAATEGFDLESSDLDFLVVFGPLTPVEHKESYFGLISDLEGLFSRPVDLVEYSAIRNPYFKADIVRTRVTLYEAA